MLISNRKWVYILDISCWKSRQAVFDSFVEAEKKTGEGRIDYISLIYFNIAATFCLI